MFIKQLTNGKYSIVIPWLIKDRFFYIQDISIIPQKIPMWCEIVLIYHFRPEFVAAATGFLLFSP